MCGGVVVVIWHLEMDQRLLHRVRLAAKANPLLAAASFVASSMVSILSFDSFQDNDSANFKKETLLSMIYFNTNTKTRKYPPT